MLIFSKEGLIPLVEYNEKKIFEVKLKEMKSALTTQIAEEVDISEVIDTVKQRVKDAKLPDIEIVRILWDVLMDAVQWSGKNQQQNANSALRQVWLSTTLFLTHFMNNIEVIFHLIYGKWKMENDLRLTQMNGILFSWKGKLTRCRTA